MLRTGLARSFSNAGQIGFAFGYGQKVDPRQFLAESALVKLKGNRLEFPVTTTVV
jgi:hypothetical protein